MNSHYRKMSLLVSVIVLAFASVAIAQDQPSFTDLTAATEELASRYVDLYLDLNFDEMEPLLHADASFNDPTANKVFGSKLVSGKEAVLSNFREVFESITDAKLEINRSFASGDVAVFESNITWSFTVQAGKNITIRDMPLVLVITVADGLVISHRDHGDYRVFMTQYQEQMK